MTKKEKQKHLTAEEVKHQVSEEAEQAIDARVAADIEAILKSSNRALQPFIQHTEVASIARVRLVRAIPEPTQAPTQIVDPAKPA